MFSEIRENKRLEKQEKIDKLGLDIDELKRAIDVLNHNIAEMEETKKESREKPDLKILENEGYNLKEDSLGLIKLKKHRKTLLEKLAEYKKELEKIKK